MYNQPIESIKTLKEIRMEVILRNLNADLKGCKDDEQCEYIMQEIEEYERMLDTSKQQKRRVLVVGRHDPDDDTIDAVMHSVTWPTFVGQDMIQDVFDAAETQQCEAILFQNFPAQLATAMFAVMYDWGNGTLRSPYTTVPIFTVVNEPRPELRGKAPEYEIQTLDVEAVLKTAKFANPRMFAEDTGNGVVRMVGQAPMPFKRTAYIQIA